MREIKAETHRPLFFCVPTFKYDKIETKELEGVFMIEELKKSLDVMKDILDNAYQGMVLVDGNGLI